GRVHRLLESEQCLQHVRIVGWDNLHHQHGRHTARQINPEKCVVDAGPCQATCGTHAFDILGIDQEAQAPSFDLAWKEVDIERESRISAAKYRHFEIPD